MACMLSAHRINRLLDWPLALMRGPGPSEGGPAELHYQVAAGLAYNLLSDSLRVSY